MIEMLLGFVNEGIQLLAMVKNPLLLIEARFGMMPSSIPCSKCSGSKPSTHTTTVGVRGSEYCLECRVTVDQEATSSVCAALHLRGVDVPTDKRFDGHIFIK
jgi:hypothetical protein